MLFTFDFVAAGSLAFFPAHRPLQAQGTLWSGHRSGCRRSEGTDAHFISTRSTHREHVSICIERLARDTHDIHIGLCSGTRARVSRRLSRGILRSRSPSVVARTPMARMCRERRALPLKWSSARTKSVAERSERLHALRSESHADHPHCPRCKPLGGAYRSGAGTTGRLRCPSRSSARTAKITLSLESLRVVLVTLPTFRACCHTGLLVSRQMTS